MWTSMVDMDMVREGDDVEVLPSALRLGQVGSGMVAAIGLIALFLTCPKRDHRHNVHLSSISLAGGKIHSEPKSIPTIQHI